MNYEFLPSSTLFYLLNAFTLAINKLLILIVELGSNNNVLSVSQAEVDS